MEVEFSGAHSWNDSRRVGTNRVVELPFLCAVDGENVFHGFLNSPRLWDRGELLVPWYQFRSSFQSHIAQCKTG